MGLLDNANWNDPILAMAAGLLGSQTLGQGLSRGLLGAQQAQERGQDAAMKRQYYQSLLAENQAQTEERRAKLAELERARQAREAFAASFRAPTSPQAGFNMRDPSTWQKLPYGGTTPGAAEKLPDAGGPATPEKLPMGPGQQALQMSPDLILRGLNAGYTIDQLKAMVESNNWGRPKVARVIDVQGPDGRPMQQGLDEFQQLVGAPMPKPYERRLEDMGGTKQAYDPYTGGLTGTALPKTMTPDAVASNQLGWANNRIAAGNLGVAQAGLGLRQQELNQGKWQYDAERGIVTNPLTGEARPVTMGNQPIGPKGQASSQQRVTEATDALALIDQARQLIPSSTNSYAGAGVDQVARVFGKSTQGAQAAAQLKAIEGALIAKMPKMSGPQSDKDVLLYRQMAGQVGDATLPAETRLAALQTIEEIQRRYAGMGNAPIISRGNSTTVNGKVGAPAAPTVDDLLRKYGGG